MNKIQYIVCTQASNETREKWSDDKNASDIILLQP